MMKSLRTDVWTDGRTDGRQTVSIWVKRYLSVELQTIKTNVNLFSLTYFQIFTFLLQSPKMKLVFLLQFISRRNTFNSHVI